ncbi:MAG: transposase [Candidatus Beckwithbacteria bacterium]|nr:transposase [Patescibacteria group bacterium]
MPSEYYNRNFRPQYFYHIFNRGAYKNKIFLNKSDYEIFTSILSYYLLYPKTRNFAYQKKVNKFQVRNLEKEQTVHLVAYCLMPNHFHLLLRQLPNATKKTNISNLMKRLSITYAMYFQNKYDHAGTLFQGKFKNTTVETDEQLLFLSRYIHTNPKKLTKQLGNYLFSSYPVYINKVKSLKWIQSKYILRLNKDYKSFVELPLKDKEITKIEKLVLE